MILAGTGHRPDKLLGYGLEAHHKLIEFAESWLMFRSEPISRIISGGALGWDQALAEAALNRGIPVTFALPFPGFEDRWPGVSKLKLYSLMERAETTVFVCDPGYAGWKMQKRNQWMVDHCDAVIALWNGSPGGTSNCVAYAEKTGKRIWNLWEYFERWK